MIFVSSCLMGNKCTFREDSNLCKKVVDFVKEEEIVKVCPECMGNLPIPRDAAVIVGGSGIDVVDGGARVVTDSSEDVTDDYLRGAEEVLKLAKELNPDVIIFKARSPSCGCGKIRDNTGKLIDGDGVATALLKKKGFQVICEDDID